MATLVYAKKILLPASNANTLQSLNMAWAFGRAGVAVRFLPGFRAWSRPGAGGILEEALRSQGLEPEGARSWSLAPLSHKGLYGAAFRGFTAGLLLRLPRAAFYARDVGEALFMTSFAARLGLKRRVFFEMHEILFRQKQLEGRRDWERTRQMERAILERASGVVVTSEFMREDLDGLGYAGPVLVEPNGYNPFLFGPLPLFEPENPWPGPQDKVRLVYVGNFHPGKGAQELVEALRFLPERFSLRLIGGDPQNVFACLKEQAATLPGGAGRVEFWGRLPQSAVAQACRGCHIFMLPQQENGGYFSPLKITEAWALGLPLLSTPVNVFEGLRQRELAFSSAGFGPEALAEAARELAERPSLAAALRKNGLNAAAERAWTARASRILHFMES